MNDFFEKWRGSSERNRKLFERERLILSVTERICELLEDSNVTKAELATKLETSKAHVSQLLNGSRNMTLGTLSDVLFAIEAKVEIRIFSRKDEWKYSYSPPEALVALTKTLHQDLYTAPANDSGWKNIGSLKTRVAKVA